MKTAVIYARYSSERQTEQSIDGQLRVCREYAERNDLVVINEYIDRATTGTNDNRESFQKMMKDSGKKIWDYVLVYKLDRFSRNKYEMAMHKKSLRDNGVKLVSATENIPDTPEGIILESLLEGMAEYYSAELSQKVKRGLNESRIKGRFTGGHIIYGYNVTGNKAEGRKLVINEDEAKIVKYIFEQYACGTTVKEIISDLKNKGISQRGKPFPKNTILHILHNEKYLGVCSIHGKTYENIYPRILSDELFNSVKRITDKNKYGKDSVIARYLLRGKVICGLCGNTMNGDAGTARNGERKHYYNCNSRKYNHTCKKIMVKKDALENIVIDSTVKVLSNSRTISEIADMILERHKTEIQENSVINLLIKDRDKTQTAIDNIVSAIEQGIITSSTKKRLNDLELVLEEIQTKIKIAQAKKNEEIKKNDIIYYIKNCLKKEPKQMIELLIDKIILYDDKIEIYYNFDKQSPDNTSRGFLFYTKIIDASIFFNQYNYLDENKFLIKLYC